MMAVALKGLLGRKFRATLTAFAIVLGVGMVSGSFVLTDTIQKSFEAVLDDSYEHADVVISSKEAIQTGAEDAAPPAFSADVLAKVRALPGVEAAAGTVLGFVGLVGADGKQIGQGGSGSSVDASDGDLNPLTLASGDWPRGGREIAIDKATADDEQLDVGDTVGAFSRGPVQNYRIAGIVRFASEDSIGFGTLAAFDVPTAQALFDKRGKLDEIQVAAEPGVTADELTKKVSALLPPTAEAKSASAKADEASNDLAGELNDFRTFLLAFGVIALFVGSFVIANTLAITVAQRMRELATLRTLGASRKQVLWSVLLEAVVVGLVASVVGLFLGFGLALGLKALLGAIGIDLPGGGLVFATRTVVVSLLVGTVISVLASLRPAVRATRVAPISAVREGATLPESRLARRGLLIAGIVLAAALVLLGYGVFASGVPTATRLLSLGVGAGLLFIGVTLVAPRLVRPLATVLGAPGARLGGAVGELARENATRNPSRTASTAAALMIGLALITFVAVLGQGLKTSFVDAVDQQFVADYALTAGDAPLTSDAARAAGQAPGVTAVSEIRTGRGEAFGETVDVDGVDANLTKVIAIDWLQGSDAVPAALGTDGAVVKEDYAESNDLRLGSPLLVTTPTAEVLRLKVEGIFSEPKGGSPFGEVGISVAAYDAAFENRDNQFTFLNVEGGPTEANTARLDEALARFPDAEVQTRDEFKDTQIADLETIINIVYALLGLSVIVSLFGIVNTLVLSVFERTRELGMLRAIGMTRRQVRRMIRYESVVTALIGAVFGIGVGLFLAALVTSALSDEGVVFAVPYASLVAFVIAAIVAGILAAILPARRASRLNVLNALQYE